MIDLDAIERELRGLVAAYEAPTCSRTDVDNLCVWAEAHGAVLAAELREARATSEALADKATEYAREAIRAEAERDQAAKDRDWFHDDRNKFMRRATAAEAELREARALSDAMLVRIDNLQEVCDSEHERADHYQAECDSLSAALTLLKEEAAENLRATARIDPGSAT